MFPEVKLISLVASRSDNSPILLNRFKMEVNRVHRRFRFENLWLLEPDIDDVVKEGWQRSGGGGDVVANLGGCVDSLQKWSRRIRMKFKEDIDECRK